MLKSKCCGKEAISSKLPSTGDDYFCVGGCSEPCEVVEETPKGATYTLACKYCDEHTTQPPTESWQKTFLEAGTKETGIDLSVMIKYVSDILSQAEARHREEIIKLIEGMRKTRKPTHGPCCTCQECGYCYESGSECECARNKVLDEVIKYLKE